MCRPDDSARTGLIYRQVSFTLPAFDRLKTYQQHFETTEGRRMTNSEVLDRLILSCTPPCRRGLHETKQEAAGWSRASSHEAR